MARVKTEKVIYSVGGQCREFNKVVTVDTRDGLFRIKMPMEVGLATGKETAWADTLDGVEAAYKQIMKDYNSCTVQTNKVICYEFDYHSDELDPSNKTFGDSTGIMIEINAAVYLEHTGTAKSGRVNYEYEMVESRLKYPIGDYEFHRSNRYKHRVPWTKELEDFFYNTQEMMTAIIKRMHEIEQPDLLIPFALNQMLITAGEKQSG